MYAENLGAIPPNTALMIVTDGDKRYEVRITSDTEKSGTIIFTHKKIKGFSWQSILNLLFILLSAITCFAPIGPGSIKT